MNASLDFRTLTDQEIDQIAGGDANINLGAMLAGGAAAVGVALLVAGTGGGAAVAIAAAVAIGAATRQGS